MRNQRLRQFIVYLTCIVLVYLPIVHSAQLSLPSGDLIAPEVSHKVIEDTLEPGASIQLKATVTDNVGVKSVILFFRTKGVEEYQRIMMLKILGTDEYAATLGHEQLVEPGIEYYIQAVDLAGNSILHGYSFSPLTIAIAKPNITTTTGPVAATENSVTQGNRESRVVKTEPTTPTPKTKSKTWLWVVLGGLVLGTVVAVASGSGGGDGESGNGGTGTVVISGPNP